MNQRRKLLQRKHGKPVVIKDTTDFLRPQVENKLKNMKKEILSKTTNFGELEDFPKLKESFAVSSVKSRKKPIFKYNDTYGGYFHLYEYIEDPGKKKEIEVKDEKYFQRR